MAKAPTDLRSLARAHTAMGVHVLAGIASNGQSESARVRAVELLWERGWGKAPTTIAGENGEGGLEIIIRHIVQVAGQVAGEQPAKTIEHPPLKAVQP